MSLTQIPDAAGAHRDIAVPSQGCPAVHSAEADSRPVRTRMTRCGRDPTIAERPRDLATPTAPAEQRESTDLSRAEDRAAHQGRRGGGRLARPGRGIWQDIWAFSRWQLITVPWLVLQNRIGDRARCGLRGVERADQLSRDDFTVMPPGRVPVAVHDASISRRRMFCVTGSP